MHDDMYVTLSSATSDYFPQNRGEQFSAHVYEHVPETTKVTLVGLKTPRAFNVADSSILSITTGGTSTVHVLKSGLYRTPESLNRLVRTDADSVFSIKIRKGRVHVSLKTGIRIVGLKGSISTALGYSSEDVTIDRQNNLVADEEFRYGTIKTLFLECDFITSEFVDRTRRNVLAIVHSTENEFVNTVPVEFKKVTRSQLNTISFSIRNFQGKYVDFVPGTVILRLLFSHMNE